MTAPAAGQCLVHRGRDHDAGSTRGMDATKGKCSMTDQSTTPHEEIDARILRMESQLPLSHYYTLNGDGCVIRYEAAVWMLEQIKQARAALKEIHALTCQDTDALTVTGIAERGLAGMSTATQMYEARRGAS